VTRSIIAFNTGTGVRGESVVFSCSNVYGNSLGDVVQGIDGGGNIQVDPEFCAVDPVSANVFTIQNDSGCAPGNHPSGHACSLIGAGGVGCEDVAVQKQNWGAVKRMYRE